MLLLQIKAYELHILIFHRQSVLIFCIDLKEQNNCFILYFNREIEIVKKNYFITLLLTDKDFLVYIHQLRGKKQKENSIFSCFLREQVEVQCEMYLKYSEGPK